MRAGMNTEKNTVRLQAVAARIIRHIANKKWSGTGMLQGTAAGQI